MAREVGWAGVGTVGSTWDELATQADALHNLNEPPNGY